MLRHPSPSSLRSGRRGRNDERRNGNVEHDRLPHFDCMVVAGSGEGDIDPADDVDVAHDLICPVHFVRGRADEDYRLGWGRGGAGCGCCQRWSVAFVAAGAPDELCSTAYCPAMALLARCLSASLAAALSWRNWCERS